MGGRPIAQIVIRDHGPGVPEDSIDDLFAPFLRIVDHGATGSDGAGLGLAITKRTFEVHGGSAHAVNAATGGLLVTLEVPAAGGMSVQAPDAA